MKSKIKRKCLVFCLAILMTLGGCERKPEKVQSTGTAMGTIISQTLYVKDAEGDRYTEEVLQEIGLLEGEISRRIEDSEIAKLNSNRSSVVSDELLQVLQETTKISKDSDGALDISIGELVLLWNIDELLLEQENGKIPTKEEIENALQKVNYNNIRFEENNVILDGNIQLDLGAIGKGYACDRVLDYLKKQENITGGIVSIGGSVVTYGCKPDGNHFKIGIMHPREDGMYLGFIEVMGECFISTSGDYERFIEVDGKRYHHILDPHTGYPAESDLCSVTVVCDNGFLSDALSTACFVLGKEDGMKLVEKYGAEALFVDQNLNITMTSGMEKMFTQKMD